MNFIVRWALRVIPSGYTWAAVGVIIAVIAAGSFWQGYKVASNAAESDQLKAVERAIEQAERIAAENAEIERDYVYDRERIRIVYRKIRQEVVRYVDAHPEIGDCSLDADGLQLWNAASKGSDSPTPR